MPASRLINRNVVAGRGRTSMRLEPETWEALREICRREDTTLGALIRRIERQGDPSGRTSAVRVYALQYFRAAATEDGHLAAGHGPGFRPEDRLTEAVPGHAMPSLETTAAQA
ncbi:MAG TPA: ribbon-helix-helix domain-containing protein [Acetobacteraceae bacterium]|nr:ribbon-helix-helix domain-containing protein [Acetobacteraceae bacterium]